jgi:hypothetical protein
MKDMWVIEQLVRFPEVEILHIDARRKATALRERLANILGKRAVNGRQIDRLISDIKSFHD